MALRQLILAVLLVPALAGAGNPITDCGSGKIGCAPQGVWTGTFRGKPLTCCVTDHRCDAAFPNPTPLTGQCILGKHKRRIITLEAEGQGFLCHGTIRRRGPCCTFTAPSSSSGAFVGAAECKNVLNVPLALRPN